MSGRRNISVNNVKTLFKWLNTNFGEPSTQHITIYNVDYYIITGNPVSLKGMVFEPFWSENGYRFRTFWSEIGYGYRGNVHKSLFSFPATG